MCEKFLLITRTENKTVYKKASAGAEAKPTSHSILKKKIPPFSSKSQQKVKKMNI